MRFFWLAAAVVFGVLEAATAQLVSIWFTVGAVGALIAELLGGGIWIQCMVFVVLSALVLIFTRPLVKKLTKNSNVKTNADSLIGKTAVMTASTDNMGNGGELKIDGKYWTVCSSGGEVIEKDSLVLVEKIEGVKLMVKAKNKAEETV